MLSALPASSRHPQYSEVADARVTSREGTRWVSGLQSSSPLWVDPHGPQVPRASGLQHPLPLQQTPQSQEERPRPSSVRLSSTLAELLLCPRHCAGPRGHTSELLNTLEQASAVRQGRRQDGGGSGHRRDCEARAIAPQPCPAPWRRVGLTEVATGSGFLGWGVLAGRTKSLGNGTVKGAALGARGGHLARRCLGRRAALRGGGSCQQTQRRRRSSSR